MEYFNKFINGDFYSGSGITIKDLISEKIELQDKVTSNLIEYYGNVYGKIICNKRPQCKPLIYDNKTLDLILKLDIDNAKKLEIELDVLHIQKINNFIKKFEDDGKVTKSGNKRLFLNPMQTYQLTKLYNEARRLLGKDKKSFGRSRSRSRSKRSRSRSISRSRSRSKRSRSRSRSRSKRSSKI
jgi:hypothetical protein